MLSSRIATRYVLGNKLGSGGMGDVYQGLDERTNSPVAIKILKPELATPEMVARFIREGEALRLLNHPNIVKLLDAVSENGQHYLIMELVDGGALDEILSVTPRLPIAETLNLALDLADALTRAHRLKIIHRDIKPANVLMASDGMPRLTDFGIARVVGSDITEAGSVIGTAAYIAPELFRGAAADTRSDIWSLGVMLFEVLAGVHPFRSEGQHPGAFIHDILHAPPPDLEALRPDIPNALADLIYRMTTKNPDERIPSMRLVGSELEAILVNKAPFMPVLNDATEIVQLVPNASRFDTPTTEKASEIRKHNLPVQTTPFVGRESELETLGEIIRNSDVRMVTITAHGGMGKTRLALELASILLKRTAGDALFEHGIYFVDLAPLKSAEHIPGATAEAIQYTFQQGDRDAQQQLLDYLREKNLLLIFDNFEHVVEGRALLQDILQTAPLVKILVTSREKLSLSAETVFNLSGMEFPEWETPEDALEYSAVKLFLQSARRVRSDFKLESGDLTFVARICRFVHGTPLGILLAASWLEALSPAEIVGEMSHSLDFLESNLHDLPERQRSLRAVFNYSWELLAAPERGLFAAFSMFRGGFTRDAALAITGASLRALTTLVNKSMLRRDTVSGRYEVHELLRQFAAEKLQQLPNRVEIYDAHSRYYVGLLAQLMPSLKGHGQLEALTVIETDFENIRAGWNRAVEQRMEAAIETGSEGLFLFLTLRNRVMDGEQLFEAGRQAWQVNGEDSAPLAGKMLVRFPQGDVLAAYRLGLEIAERHQDAFETAFCQRLLGQYLSHHEFRQDEGIPLMEASLKNFEALGDTYYVAQVLDELGWSYQLMLDLKAQERVVKRSLALRRALGDKIGIGNSLRNMGWTGGYFDTTDRAFVSWGEAKTIAYEMNDRLNIAWNASLQAANVLLKGEFDHAERLLDEGYPYATEIGDPVVTGYILLLRAAVAGLRDEDYAAAARLLKQGYPAHTPPDFRVTFVMLPASIVACGLHDFRILQPYILPAMQMLPLHREQFVAALCFPATLLNLSVQGQYRRAAELLRACLEIKLSYADLGFPMQWAERWALLKRLRAQLETELGAEAFQAAWEHGGEISAGVMSEEIRLFLQQIEDAESGEP